MPVCNVDGGDCCGCVDCMEVETEERQEWAITDDSGADWALRRIKQAREIRDRMIDHHKRQIEKAAAECDGIEQRLGAKLLNYFQTLPVRETKTQRAYDLPSGKLVLKRQQPKFEPDDAPLSKWLLDNGMTDKVKTVYKPLWGDLKPLTHVEGGDVVLTATGEIIPGIKAIERPDEFRMEV